MPEEKLDPLLVCSRRSATRSLSSCRFRQWHRPRRWSLDFRSLEAFWEVDVSRGHFAIRQPSGPCRLEGISFQSLRYLHHGRGLAARRSSSMGLFDWSSSMGLLLRQLVAAPRGNPLPYLRQLVAFLPGNPLPYLSGGGATGCLALDWG